MGAIPTQSRPWVIAIVGAATTLAFAADHSAAARFEVTQAPSSGHVLLHLPGGQYLYGAVSDERRPQKAFGFGRGQRDDYDFFSWQEEEALWALLQEVPEREEPLEVRSVRRSGPARPLRGRGSRIVPKAQDTVCVPALSRVQAPDQREQVVCTSPAGKTE